LGMCHTRQELVGLRHAMSELTIADILGERFAGRRFLRPNDLFELGVVDNRSTLDLWIDQGLFPTPLRVGKRCLLFPVSEIAAVLIARAREREASQPSSKYEDRKALVSVNTV
jgi:predicted DNA-binding transcriptional regulator AlpA